jgi:Tfp pilus assembly major pilin PilA
MSRVHSKGFSVIEIGLVISVVAIIGGLGFVFYNKWSASQSTTAQTTVPAKAPAAVPTISKTSDLTAASATLDSADVTSSADTNALNSDLSF